MKLRYQMRGLGIGILVTALLMGVATKEGRPLTDAEIKAKAYALGMVDSDSIRLTDLKGSTPSPQGTQVPGGTAAPQGTQQSGEPQASGEPATPQGTQAPEGTAAPQGTQQSGEPQASGEPVTPQGTQAPEGTTSLQGTQASGVTAAPQGTPSPEGTTSPQGTQPSGGTQSTQNPSESDGSGEAVTVVIMRGAHSYSISVQLAEAGLIEDADKFDSYLCDNGYAEKVRAGIYQIEPGTSEEQIVRIITKTAE